jgi:hypothetical protein
MFPQASLGKEIQMKRMIAILSIAGALVVAHYGSASAMTWTYKDVYGATSSACTGGGYDRAGYMNAKRYQSGCYVNSTTSAYDTDLSTDFFTGGSLSVTGSYHWRNSQGNNYKVYSSVNCMGAAISVPNGQGVSTASITDRSVSTTAFEAQCRS